MTGPPVGWVVEAARRVTAPASDVASLAAWAGGDAPAGATEALIDRPAALEGVLNLRIAAVDGRTSTLSAWYARDAGPLLAEAAEALGAWREYPRPAGPYEGEFAGAAPEGWRLLGSLRVPPGEPDRRLIEIALVRDAR